jgi:hypothetical protein
MSKVGRALREPALVPTASSPQAVSTKGFDPARMEAWRPALIAFYRADGPWFQKIENLTRGDPFTAEDLRLIECLKATAQLLPIAA